MRELEIHWMPMPRVPPRDQKPSCMGTPARSVGRCEDRILCDEKPFTGKVAGVNGMPLHARRLAFFQILENASGLELRILDVRLCHGQL